MTNPVATGSLYIVATPIGNLGDISLRALDILKSVDLVLAEDTRHSQQLFTALGIKNTLSSLHAHNEGDKSKQIIEQLLAGKNIALISDAGTPLISDPGYPLVNLARQQQLNVIPIPGACALITALSAAGVPCDSFLFSGFLPAKKAARITKLKELAASQSTLVFYESTHRILDCIDDIAEVYGSASSLVIAKELTKSFERFITGSTIEVKQWLEAENGRTNGEFVVIIPPREHETNEAEHNHILSVLLAELPLKQAVAIACKLTNSNKNELYEQALKLKNAASEQKPG
ncbi:MAG: 16S rRNA (cytidine(1402)-2'-O)-methyltransferase [Legionella sp.]